MNYTKIHDKYSHPSKLNQAFYLMIFSFYQIDKLIRSTEIQLFLFSFYNIVVTKRWINKILSNFGVIRPLGRPKKVESSHSKCANNEIFENSIDKQYVEQIGLKLILNLTKSLRLSDVFVESILSSIENQNNTIIPKNRKSLNRFINTLSCIAFDPRVHNFEEAKRSELPHKDMDIERCRQIIKEFDKLEDIIFKVSMDTAEYWISKLKLLEEEKDIVVYVDSHSTPYYSKQDFVCGNISNSTKIMPGTHNSICCIESGYVLFLSVNQVNTHLNRGLTQLCIYLKHKLGGLVSLIVVDRECNGKDFNIKLRNDFNIGVLSLLNSNQYKSINDFDYYWIEENQLAIGMWKKKSKRIKDNRYFLLYLKEGKLIVFTTTSNRYKYQFNAVNYYKNRWLYNEDVIKLLKGEFDFNVNVGNASSLIPNPKIKELNTIYTDKIINCKESLIELERNRLENILSDNNPVKYENAKQKLIDRLKKHYKDYTDKRKKLCNEVRIRHLGAQSFFNILKCNLYNLILYLLSVVNNNSKQPLSYGVERLLDLLINRSGYIIYSKSKIEYLFHTPNYIKDAIYLSKFLKEITKMELRDEKGRLIITKLYSDDT